MSRRIAARESMCGSLHGTPPAVCTAPSRAPSSGGCASAVHCGVPRRVRGARWVASGGGTRRKPGWCSPLVASRGVPWSGYSRGGRAVLGTQRRRSTVVLPRLGGHSPSRPPSPLHSAPRLLRRSCSCSNPFSSPPTCSCSSVSTSSRSNTLSQPLPLPPHMLLQQHPPTSTSREHSPFRPLPVPQRVDRRPQPRAEPSTVLSTSPGQRNWTSSASRVSVALSKLHSRPSRSADWLFQEADPSSPPQPAPQHGSTLL